jgi:hypothetical protein
MYEIVDDGEVSRIGREKGHAMDVGGCGDREVGSAGAVNVAAVSDRDDADNVLFVE